ncbi:hypothetical protein CA54_12910 [Symmachiella macrocystis]|uniref:Cyclic-phosphate processing Receiver domain-containing protein n=1 Tax=Symmachiella macrocystis TaxID=2527985 RepID=A0A5C6BLC0_9PLAN|nr:cyclic-phosphate processing receiver domain-containing protein [Symmachiella macrocystis]TWU12467.1 hypothetical protein CA54_12910 [Symmachiella macrocystis]
MTVDRVLMLEDEEERVVRFRKVLAKLNSALRLIVWETAHSMITEAPAELHNVAFISLDHDLYTESDIDPGDGLDVANFLVEQPPCCPVIIHTTNSPRAVYMTGALEIEGWEVIRAVPWGDNWIEEDWRYLVKEILRRPLDA